MKFLASVTIILSLPTLIASFYGMNVRLPLGGHEMAFVFIGLASVVLMLVTLLVFWRKDWL
jgi:magnesium transporter